MKAKRVFVMALLLCAVFSADILADNPEALQITNTAEAITLTVPVSKLSMTIPQSDLQFKVPTVAEKPQHPGYFILADKTEQIIISGWFKPANQYAEFKAQWDQFVIGNKNKGLPDFQDIQLEEIGNWEMVSYNIPLPQGNSRNIRTRLLQSGTGLDLHLSYTSDATISEAALKAKLLSVFKSIQIKEKN